MNPVVWQENNSILCQTTRREKHRRGLINLHIGRRPPVFKVPAPLRHSLIRDSDRGVSCAFAEAESVERGRLMFASQSQIIVQSIDRNMLVVFGSQLWHTGPDNI